MYKKKDRGIRSIISISKIKNIKLIKKNWILKGIRVLEIGSNPHSNGEFFSRWLYNFLNNKKLIKMREREKKTKIIKNKNILII